MVFCSLHAFRPFPPWPQRVTSASLLKVISREVINRSKKDVLLWRIVAQGTPPHMEDPENTSPFPMIHHHCPLKMETGARVSPALVNPSARKMELGHWREQGARVGRWWKQKKKRDQDKKRMLWYSPKTDSEGLKGNPIEGRGFQFTLNFPCICDPLRLSTFK